MKSESFFVNLLGAKHPYLVGVLNVTPDSFSDGGADASFDAAISRGHVLADEGADIIEIGGESTRPGSTPVSLEEELRRILPVVKELSKSHVVSVDTYKSETARQAIECGATIINDISALRADPRMGEVVRQGGAGLVLMYSKERATHPHATDSSFDYSDVVSEIRAFLKERIRYAVELGISQDRIVVDPGLGKFISHDAKYSWEILQRFNEFIDAELSVPVMVGSSRKGFLGGDLNSRDPVSQLTSLMAVLRGATFVRTHNVKMAREFLGVWSKIER